MFLQYLFQIAVPLISKCHTLLTQGKACLAFQRCRDTSRKLDMSSRAGIGNRWWTGDPKRSGQASLFLFHQSLVYSWVSAHLTVYVKGSQVYILPFLRSENEAGCNIPCLRPLRCATTLRSADVVLVLRSDSNVDAVTHQPTNTHTRKLPSMLTKWLSAWNGRIADRIVAIVCLGLESSSLWGWWTRYQPTRMWWHGK